MNRERGNLDRTILDCTCVWTSYTFGCTHIRSRGTKHRSPSTVLYYTESRLPAVGVIAFWSATPENYFRPTAPRVRLRSRGLARFSGRGPCELITDRLSPLPVRAPHNRTRNENHCLVNDITRARVPLDTRFSVEYHRVCVVFYNWFYCTCGPRVIVISPDSLRYKNIEWVRLHLVRAFSAGIVSGFFFLIIMKSLKKNKRRHTPVLTKLSISWFPR